MTWAAEIVRPEVGVRFYLKIQGIGDVYYDGETPVGPTGVPWTAPTSKGLSYTHRPAMLDVGKGLGSIGADIVRRTGTTTPGSLTLTLADNRDGYLRTLFAGDKSTGKTARLSATLAYDTAGAGTMITCDDVTPWATSGYAYIGLETAYYASKAGSTQLNAQVASGGARDVFSIGSCDTTSRYNAHAPMMPRLVSDWPTVWHGRYVQLFAYLVDVDGRAYDAAIDGTYSREIWRGIIQGDPHPTDSWMSWTLETKSIDVILQTEVGRAPVKASLTYVTAAQKNSAQQAEDMGKWAPGEAVLWFIDANTRNVPITIEHWADATAMNAAPTTVVVYTGADIALTEDTYNSTTLAEQFNSTVETAINGSFPYLTITIKKVKGTPAWMLTIASEKNGPTQTAHRVTLNGNAANGVWLLLGFHGAPVVVSKVANPLEAGSYHVGHGEQASIRLHPDATKVPIFYDPTALGVDTPPTSGFALIGGKEVVSYTGISASATIANMHTLTGVKRGALGTSAIEHVVRWQDDPAQNEEGRQVIFGTGFDSVSLFEVILQLAISTGSAHHGAYDTLAARVSPGLPPGHFDTTAIAKLSDGMQPTSRNVSFFLSKPVKLGDLIAEFLGPLAMFQTSRTNADGDYLITFDHALPPLESEATQTLGTGQLHAERPGTWRNGNDLIINRILWHYHWDVLKEAPSDRPPHQATDDDSMYDYVVRGSLEFKLRGYLWHSASAATNLAPFAAQIFARYGKPYALLTLRVDRTGWLVKPGDVVTVTLPSAPSPTGAAGITARNAVVIKASHKYHDPDGETGSELLVVLERDLRQSTYSPSARVTAAAGGPPPTITLAANQYTVSGDGTDADHFENGDVVVILNQGDWTTTNQRTLSNRNGNTFDVDSAVTVVVGANTRMIPAGYAAVQAAQRKHAFLASNAHPPVLTVSTTTAFRYV